MKTKFIGVVLLLMLSLPSLAAAQNKKDRLPFEFALWKNKQFLGEDKDVRGLRLSLLYGKNKNVYGLDLGLGLNEADTLWGLQIGGINNVHNVRGVQIGLLGYHFAESGVLSNKAQVVWGSQIGLLANKCEGDIWGLQMAGYKNETRGDVLGVQIGLYNVATGVKGVQIGIINYCEKMVGVQIGILNIIEEGEFPLLPIVNASLSF